MAAGLPFDIYEDPIFDSPTSLLAVLDPELSKKYLGHTMSGALLVPYTAIPLAASGFAVALSAYLISALAF